MRAHSPSSACRFALRGEKRALHSVYNPEKEAERYIESLALQNNTAYFILIECGLCYVVPYLRKKSPSAKIISLHIADEYMLSNTSSFYLQNNIPDAEWSPSSGISCADFLEKEIEDIESDKIKIIEWRAALSLNAGSYLCLLTEAVDFIKRADANTRSMLHFSGRWKRNAEKNLAIIKTRASSQEKSVFLKSCNNKNIIICASGPSLEHDIYAIKKMKAEGQYDILAVSSSIEMLAYHHIVPDIIISCDGGNWARLHLYPIIRECMKEDGSYTNVVVAASLNAALLSDFSGFTPDIEKKHTMPALLLFGDGSPEQNELLKKAGLPPYALPSRGTVAASAVDFALLWTTGNIYISGLDLANNDVRSHARPYAFDILLSKDANRLNPYYSMCYQRTEALDRGDSYRIYKDWFKKEALKYPPRVFYLSDKEKRWTIHG
ncbi:MAG: DUF115 domain-containing protein [Spirochaetaceae bacterium]|jgi:hypothetical protein|nr:DUF115 domain-containing protein [Spirochaetaceae bacterium]